MRRLELFLILVSALGLALYLWGALAAPVVLWSDSRIDMDWARNGIGISRPVPAPPPGEPLVHPPKPGYLVFLAVAMRAAPGLGPARSVVLVQSLLLWLSIVATCWFTLRRTGGPSGLWACVLLLAALRVRDAAGAVMSEAISAALFLPLAALCVWKPSRSWAFACAGVAAAVLFAIRPDAGAVLFLLMAASLLHGRNWRALGVFAAAFAVLTLGVWALTRPAAGPDPLRGVGHPVLEASAEYYWRPSLGEWPRAKTQSQMGREELERAAGNWKRTLSRGGLDARRELIWRAFHGLLGTEFYDGRWSRLYGRVDEAARLLTPLFILAMIAALALPSPPGQPQSRVVGSLLLLSIVGHNLVFGSNPRYLIPVLPFLLLLLVVRLVAPGVFSVARLAVFGLVLAALVAVTFLNGEVLDWQWGRIESAGVILRQPIARGCLPAPPSTLHVRIAPNLLPTAAQLLVRGPGSQVLYSSLEDSRRNRPQITIPIPDWLAASNSKEASIIEISSFGSYDPHHFLLFPVIPPPWAAPARRADSSDLSPSTGVRAGSLDWWAHPGAD